MAVTVQEVYGAALALMDETSDSEYISRTPAIVNTLLAKVYPISEEYTGGAHSGWTKVTSMTDYLVGIDQSLALAAVPYGLAALLKLDEDSNLANSMWALFTDNCESFKRHPVDFDGIEDVYGIMDEYEEFGRWE